MSYQNPTRAWKQWREASRAAATARWASVEKLARPSMSGKEWLKQTAKRFAQLSSTGILQAHEQGRITEIAFTDLSASDQDRLGKRPQFTPTKHLYAFTIAYDKSQPRLHERFVSLHGGKSFMPGGSPCRSSSMNKPNFPSA